MSTATKNNWKKKFSIIYLGQAFSILGSAAVQFAIVWWLTMKTESAIVLTFATIAALLPNIIFGPFAGVWVDRYNRKTVMILADALVCLSSVITGIVFLLNDNPSIWFIYLVLFIRGIGSTFHGPAMQAAIPMLVPSDKLTQAGGIGSMINSLSNMIGPVVGAILMGIMPLAPIMLIDIFGAIFAIVCLLFVVIEDIEQPDEKVHFIDDVKIGYRALVSNKPLMAAFLPMMFVNIIFMPLSSLFPLLVRTHFVGDAFANSIVELSFGLGMVASSIIIGVWGGMRKRFLMASIAVGLIGLVTLLMGLLPGSTIGFIIFVVLCFLLALPSNFINVPVMAYIQETTSEKVMGKVISLIITLMTFSMPFGLLIAGPISEIIGVNTWFLISGILLVIVGIWCRKRTKKYDDVTLRP